MRFGVTLFPTDQSIDVIELGREVEDRGLDSIWFPEHTHIPISRRTPPPTGEEVLAEEYRRCLDPLVALASVAGATSRLRLGTGIALVSQREPIVTAKAVASLDLVSGGRFSLGIGFGWNEDEMEDHGVAYARRREHARDHVLAMRRLWEDDEASYEGEFVRFPPTWSWPKPVQRPLPVLIGGMAGPKLFSHIAEYAQGWIPIGGAGLTGAIPMLRDALAATGRNADDLEIVPFGSIPDQGKLEHFEKIGVTEVVMRLPSAPRDVVLPILDKQAALVAAHR